MKFGRLASVGGVVVLAGTAIMGVALPAAVASTITQAYSCSTPIGTENATVTVTGTAALTPATNTISMTGVVFTVTNPTSTTITIDHVVVRVKDPNTTSAPYITGSAMVASTPPGWTAGHSTGGAFAKHAGSLTVAGSGTISNAALSANYSDNGPAGTKIHFKPGKITFDLTSPVTGAVSCTPTAPVKSFATVTE